MTHASNGSIHSVDGMITEAQEFNDVNPRAWLARVRLHQTTLPISE